MSKKIWVATRKGLFCLERNGSDTSPWVVTDSSFLADNVTIVAPDKRDGSYMVSLDHGHYGVKMHTSKDGKNWEEIVCPTYPDPPAEPEINQMNQKEIPYNCELVWALTPGGSDQPGTWWAGTLPGGLFKSEDGGKSWTLNRELWDNPRRKKWFGGGMDWAGIHSICVNPNDSNHVVIGVSCGGVWVTFDGGKTWDTRAAGMKADYMPPESQEDPDIQDPHSVAMCAADTNTMYVQHHCGIFVTDNGGEMWSQVMEAGPSTFGFPAVVHPKDPKTAWFAPAIKDEKRIPVDGKVVITRTRDGGNSFDVLSSGLPQEHAYDLVFRHSFDVDDSGDVLAFGSTTGSVWVSEDQGDNWMHVSAHLPPVHCVRFSD